MIVYKGSMGIPWDNVKENANMYISAFCLLRYQTCKCCIDKGQKLYEEPLDQTMSQWVTASPNRMPTQYMSTRLLEKFTNN